MLTAKVLNSAATYNNFKEIESLEFIPEEQTIFVFRIFDPQLELRYIPGSSAIVTLTLNKADNTTATKTMSLNSNDRSIASVTLQETDTEDLLDGNVTFVIDEDGDGLRITKGIIYNGLARVIEGDC